MVEILNTKNIVAVTATANVIKKLTNVMSAGKVLVAHRATDFGRLVPPVHPNFEPWIVCFIIRKVSVCIPTVHAYWIADIMMVCLLTS